MVGLASDSLELGENKFSIPWMNWLDWFIVSLGYGTAWVMVQSGLWYSLGCGESGLRYSLGYGRSGLRYSLGCAESGFWRVLVMVQSGLGKSGLMTVWVKASLGCSSLGYVEHQIYTSINSATARRIAFYHISASPLQVHSNKYIRCQALRHARLT